MSQPGDERPAVRPSSAGAAWLFGIAVLPWLPLSLGISLLLCRRPVAGSRWRLIGRGSWASAVGLALAGALVAGYLLGQGVRP